jgi:hypothetical protein
MATAGESFSASGCAPTFRENFGAAMNIVRHHKVYGPKGTYEGGREKAPSEPSIRLQDGLVRTSLNLRREGEGALGLLASHTWTTREGE